MSTNELLRKYYELDCDDLNVRFEGSYDLLKYIITKYNMYCYAHPKNSKELPQITKFITQNNFSVNSSLYWKKNGVPPRVWSIVHKDMVMLRLLGKIKKDDVMTLEELEQEFNFHNRNHA